MELGITLMALGLNLISIASEKLRVIALDSRLRGNDRHSDRVVIPAKAGIQKELDAPG